MILTPHDDRAIKGISPGKWALADMVPVNMPSPGNNSEATEMDLHVYRPSEDRFATTEGIRIEPMANIERLFLSLHISDLPSDYEEQFKKDNKDKDKSTKDRNKIALLRRHLLGRHSNRYLDILSSKIPPSAIQNLKDVHDRVKVSAWCRQIALIKEALDKPLKGWIPHLGKDLEAAVGIQYTTYSISALSRHWCRGPLHITSGVNTVDRLRIESVVPTILLFLLHLIIAFIFPNQAAHLCQLDLMGILAESYKHQSETVAGTVTNATLLFGNFAGRSLTAIAKALGTTVPAAWQHVVSPASHQARSTPSEPSEPSSSTEKTSKTSSPSPALSVDSTLTDVTSRLNAINDRLDIAERVLFKTLLVLGADSCLPLKDHAKGLLFINHVTTHEHDKLPRLVTLSTEGVPIISSVYLPAAKKAPAPSATNRGNYKGGRGTGNRPGTSRFDDYDARGGRDRGHSRERDRGQSRGRSRSRDRQRTSTAVRTT